MTTCDAQVTALIKRSEPSFRRLAVMTCIRPNIIGASRISCGERDIHPGSPQLFSMALFLAAESGKDTPREDLIRLFYPSAISRARSSHNLRQLLYRLRALGIPLELRGSAVQCEPRSVRDCLAPLGDLSPRERANLPRRSFVVLPGYAPSLPRPFLDWLDTLRARLERSLRGLLSQDLASLQKDADWLRVTQSAQNLLSLDPLSFAAVRSLAESLVVQSRTEEALTTIDDYIAECADPGPRVDAQRLRRRITSYRKPTTAEPFVGRADTLRELSEAWGNASRGESQYLVLSGAAGIGKTRVARALSDLAVTRGARVIEQSCGETDRHRPLSLFVRLTTALMTMPGSLGISPSAYAQVVRLGGTESWPIRTHADAISSEIVRGEIHDSLVDLVDAVASETPLLIIIDDAHLLDSSSWSVLRSVFTRVQSRSLMVLLCTRSTVTLRSYAPISSHCRVITLGRLSEADSRQLLHALSPDECWSTEALAAALRQAAGNPFFLQALAKAPRGLGQDAHTPTAIAALAARLYHSLDDASRTVLECVLLLRDHATLSRVRASALVAEEPFLRTLRLLEEDGVLRCSGLQLSCSHDLLADALWPLMPQTVVALLKERIAIRLESDCIAQGFDASLAWAAADTWLALGNAVGAARLLRRCASHAAHLAEHSEAARILGRLLEVRLPADEYLPLLEEMIEYAEIGGERSIRARALREQLRLMESPSQLARVVERRDLSRVHIALVEADMHVAGDLRALTDELHLAVSDFDLDSDLRARAAVSLLMAADLTLDAGLAEACWRDLAGLLQSLGSQHPQALRATLIYHTVFGEPAVAIRTAQQILDLHPLPQLDLVSVIARRNALFALQILGASYALRPAAVPTYDLVSTRKVHTEAVYVAVALAEDSIASGDIATALGWLCSSANSLGFIHRTSHGVAQGYLSALASIAALHREYASAASLLRDVEKRLSFAAAPRLQAVNLAYRVRLAALEGRLGESSFDLEALRSGYAAGKALGRQDAVVEALWHLLRARGEAAEASRLLEGYLCAHRREVGAVEWPLWLATRADPAWSATVCLVPDGQQVTEAPPDRLRTLLKYCEALTS